MLTINFDCDPHGGFGVRERGYFVTGKSARVCATSGIRGAVVITAAPLYALICPQMALRGRTTLFRRLNVSLTLLGGKNALQGHSGASEGQTTDNINVQLLKTWTHSAFFSGFGLLPDAALSYIVGQVLCLPYPKSKSICQTKSKKNERARWRLALSFFNKWP